MIPFDSMASQVLRRLSKAQLLLTLNRRTAAPFHVIMWDNQPVRLADAVQLLQEAADDSFYYATPERVFSTPSASN